MRCAITKPSTLRRLSRQVGFTVARAVTRGGTGHRIDIWSEQGERWCLWPDGQIWPDGALSVSTPASASEQFLLYQSAGGGMSREKFEARFTKSSKPFIPMMR